MRRIRQPSRAEVSAEGKSNIVNIPSQEPAHAYSHHHHHHYPHDHKFLLSFTEEVNLPYLDNYFADCLWAQPAHLEILESVFNLKVFGKLSYWSHVHLTGRPRPKTKSIPLKKNIIIINTSCQSIHSRNITRIAKAALHKLPGKSSLNVRSVCPVSPLWLVCPVCPVCPGCPVWPICPDDHDTHPVYHPWHAWKVSMVDRICKLEVVHKQVGGCVISYNLHLLKGS